MHRTATRYAPSQHPIFSLPTKVPGEKPADMNYLAAWKPQVLTPVAPLPSLLANCCKASGFKPLVRNVRRLQLVFFC